MDKRIDVMKPEIDNEIVDEIRDDLKEIGYMLAGITYASEYPDDTYLLYVIGKKECACKEFTYTSWIYNMSTKCLNLGHYGFTTHASCLLDVLKNRINYLYQEDM